MPAPQSLDHPSHRRLELIQLGQWLQAQNYRFATVTPATHAAFMRNLDRPFAKTLRDVFGWNLPFDDTVLSAIWIRRLLDAEIIERLNSCTYRSKVRFASLGNLLVPHSSFPTADQNAVFFGPDTYRFAALIERELAARPLAPAARVLDIGCGTGAGGLAVAGHAPPGKTVLTLADINPAALEFAHASAALAGVQSVTCHQGDLYNGLPSTPFDLIVANPPYLNDEAQRLYRHGGGRWGEALSLRIVREGLPLLAPGGRLVLYTGSCITEGVDRLHSALQDILGNAGVIGVYQEIDPDVFGEELNNARYGGVERIAAVSLVVHKR